MEKITIHTEEELNKTVIFKQNILQSQYTFQIKMKKDIMFGVQVDTSTWQHTLTYWFTLFKKIFY